MCWWGMVGWGLGVEAPAVVVVVGMPCKRRRRVGGRGPHPHSSAQRVPRAQRAGAGAEGSH